MPPKRRTSRASSGVASERAEKLAPGKKGGEALPWRSARRAAKEHLGGQTTTPSPGPRPEKFSTSKESDGAAQEGGGSIKGPDMARTVEMGWLPGARMAPPGARAQGAVAGDILGRVRARARVSRSKFHKIRAPQCHSAAKNGYADCI